MQKTISPRRQLTIPNFSSLGCEEKKEDEIHRSISFSEENHEIFKTTENFLQYTARILHDDIRTPKFISDHHFPSQSEDPGLENIEECTNESEQIKRVKQTRYDNTVKINVLRQETQVKLESNHTQDTFFKDNCSRKFACGCLIF
jgi:hypothetical protein